jgi:hypothetical protein
MCEYVSTREQLYMVSFTNEAERRRWGERRVYECLCLCARVRSRMCELLVLNAADTCAPLSADSVAHTCRSRCGRAA